MRNTWTHLMVSDTFYFIVDDIVFCPKDDKPYCPLTQSVIQTPDRQYGVLTHIDDFKGFLTS